MLGSDDEDLPVQQASRAEVDLKMHSISVHGDSLCL